jgi:uncharacterized protein (TIGR00255 family)
MIRSMTGFGKAEIKSRPGRVIIEIKTLNHKYFDLSARLANGLYALEDDIRKIIQKYVKRGKVNLNVSYEGSLEDEGGFSVNKKAAKKYLDAFNILKKSLKIKNDLELSDIINMPGVIVYKSQNRDPNLIFPKIKSALQTALERLIKDRTKEGRAIHRDFSKRLNSVKKAVAVIDKRAQVNIEDYKKTLSRKIKDLTGGYKLDKGRLEMEVALYAKNCDITEELVRLKNHVKNFISLMNKGQDVGKQLDFVAQEMQREINTIGAKSGDYKISQKVILINSEIEKIREQLKNVE